MTMLCRYCIGLMLISAGRVCTSSRELRAAGWEGGIRARLGPGQGRG